MSHLSVTPDSTAPPRRLINGSQTNGLAWVVWRELDDFLFEVTPLRAADAPPAAPIHTSPAEYSTAHKAERAAKAWCTANDPGESVDITGQTNGLDWTTVPIGNGEHSFHVSTIHRSSQLFATPQLAASEATEWCTSRAVAGGWLIEVSGAERGGYRADLYEVSLGLDGEPAPVSHGDYEDVSGALDAARTWANANPTRAERESRRAAADMDAALAGPDMSTPFDGPGEWTTELVLPVDPSAEPDEVADLRARLVLAETRLAAALALAPEDAAAEYLDLATREAELEIQITGTKEILAGLKAELTRVRRSMTKKAVSTMERISGRAPTAQLEIGGVLSTARAAGMELAEHRVTWHSPVIGTHIIEHSTEPTPAGELVTTWVTGHREATEAFGETYEQASAETKSKAQQHLGDAARMPPARVKGQKLKGHSKAAVLTAVGRTASTRDAAVELGCTPQQLTKYAEENGITLKLPEAPPAKAGKARGRRKADAK